MLLSPDVVRRLLPRRLASVLLSASVAMLSLGAAAPVYAEGTIRIAEQFGIVYLLLDVARDQKFVEQEGKKQGLDIKVDWVKLSGGAAVNDRGHIGAQRQV